MACVAYPEVGVIFIYLFIYFYTNTLSESKHSILATEEDKEKGCVQRLNGTSKEHPSSAQLQMGV